MRTIFKNRPTYNFDDPIVLPQEMINIILKKPFASDLIGLYVFYYYTAKWQKTNKPKASTTYAANGLKWTKNRLIKTKKELIKLQLIQDIKIVTSKGLITGHFIKLNYLWKNTTLLSKPDTGENQSMVSLDISSLSNGNLNALSNGILLPPDDLSKTHITSKRFISFWKIYPKKTSQGKASAAWSKLCKLPPNQRPTWKEIKTAILAQIKTPQWQNRKYIANPTTWLNQNRWLDDPKDMINYDRENDNKPEKVMDCGVWYYRNEKGVYISRKGEYFTGDINDRT